MYKTKDCENTDDDISMEMHKPVIDPGKIQIDWRCIIKLKRQPDRS